MFCSVLHYINRARALFRVALIPDGI